MRRLSRLALRVLVGVELLLALSILRDVANVTTTRLYLTRRVDAGASDASERFDIEASRVVPQIAIRRDERIAFRVDNPWPSTLRVDLRPTAPSRYEILWRESGADRVLARGESATTIPVSASIPAGSGVLELSGRGPLTWADPRLVSSLRITRRLLAFLLLAPLAILIAHRQALFRVAAFGMSLAIALIALEVGLRALSDRAPASLLAERHDLGEVRKDTRWELTLRYGRRLRAHVDDMGEWRHGDEVSGMPSAASCIGRINELACVDVGPAKQQVCSSEEVGSRPQPGEVAPRVDRGGDPQPAPHDDGPGLQPTMSSAARAEHRVA